MNSWAEMPRYITTQELCGMLRMSRGVVYLHIKEKRLPEPLRIGKRAIRHDKLKVMLMALKGMSYDDVENMTEEELIGSN